MNGKKLSEDQRQRIEEVKEEWFSKVDEIEYNLGKHTFSQSSNSEYIRLAEKYLAKIKEIEQEDNNGKR